MADQARWFKLWVTAPQDDALQELSPALRWAWAVFGCYTKAHGTRGRVEVSITNTALAAQMCVPITELQTVLMRLPNVSVEEGKNHNGTIAVTWKNWVKYQEDSTQAQRQKTSRAKRRREENKNKKRKDSPPTSSRSASSPGPPEGSRPTDSDRHGLEELHHQEAEASRVAFQQLVAGVSERIGFTLDRP